MQCMHEWRHTNDCICIVIDLLHWRVLALFFSSQFIFQHSISFLVASCTVVDFCSPQSNLASREAGHFWAQWTLEMYEVVASVKQFKWCFCCHRHFGQEWDGRMFREKLLCFLVCFRESGTTLIVKIGLLRTWEEHLWFSDWCQMSHVSWSKSCLVTPNNNRF